MSGIPKIDESDDFFEDDWDNLLILDACRLDIFREMKPETDYKYSPGSHSADFISGNFAEGRYCDIIYITANPHFSEEFFEDIIGRKPEEVFHAVFNTFEDKWSDKEGTVLPEAVIEDYKTAKKLFPEKRFVLHFMQPHVPFINSDLTQRKSFGLLYEQEKDDIWSKTEKGLLDSEKVIEAYRKNLDLIMERIEENRGEFEGNTIITSDHGNLLGENGLWGHPDKNSLEPLRKVPWYELQ